jgi:subtilase-type serine protease
MTKVLAERASTPFKNSTITYVLTVAGNPTYNSGKTVTSNALLDAHLDYALSTGLTGAGKTVGMIDDGLLTSHQQFAGKSITVAGNTAGAVDFHGTAVASVMVGTGNGGGMIGFAPGANLYAGYLNYNNSVDWALLGSYMLGAKSAGAVAVNNSWGLSGGTVANTNYSSYFGSGAGATYLADLRSYAQNGVVVFAAQNTYTDTSINTMAGLPAAYPDLQSSWLAVINVLPTMNGSTIASATRLSAPCAEAAAYCIDANGQVAAADSTNASGYIIGSGASFAAPQVTGSLALLAQAFPSLRPQQLRDRLLATANNTFYSDYSGSVTFAPGIVHSYDTQFGMGFLDLEAALLPIGTTNVPTAAGGSIPLGQPAISGGTASGNAIAASLSAAKVVYVDQMSGNFSAPASTLAAAPQVNDLSSLQLSRLQSSGFYLDQASYGRALATGSATAMLDHQDALASPDAASLFGGTETPLFQSATTHVAVVRNQGEAVGFTAAQDFTLGAGALRLGVNAFTENGAILGVTAPGMGAALTGTTRSVTIGYAAPLGRGLSLRAEGEFGTATSNGGAGMITGFSPVAYNRLGIAFDAANAFQSGDVMTLFARTPVAITSGSATLALPVSFSNGSATFANTGVALSPSAREVDVGFEYGTPVADNTLLRVGVAERVNQGNVAGQNGLDAILGFSMLF